MNSYIDMVCTKVIDLNVIDNFVLENIFIWDHLEAQIFVLCSLIMKFKLLEFYYTTLDEDILYIKCSTERQTNVLTREIKMFREGCDVIRFSRIACQIPGEALADDMQF